MPASTSNSRNRFRRSPHARALWAMEVGIREVCRPGERQGDIGWVPEDFFGESSEVTVGIDVKLHWLWGIRIEERPRYAALNKV